MQRIETRVQLIEHICDNISQSAIVRACHNGTVRVLGGFSIIPPGTRPGWIVQITSIHGSTWLVAVTSDDHNHVFRTWLAESIPWENYVGRDDQKEYSIYNGDNPSRAFICRYRASKPIDVPIIQPRRYQ